MLYTGTFWNVSGGSCTLLFLNKLDMMNKVCQLPLLEIQMCKGCNIPPASEGITAAVMDYWPC